MVNAVVEDAVEVDACAAESGSLHMKLRIAAVFIILVTSAMGSLFPIIGRRYLHVPKRIFDFAKYFGSGVLIATAFIHLLTPANESLNSECLTGWDTYPWANAIAMLAVFVLFVVELLSFRVGSAKLKAAGLSAHDAHDHAGGASHAAHGPEVRATPPSLSEADLEIESESASASGVSDAKKELDVEQAPHAHAHSHGAEGMDAADVLAQVLGVAILEFGVVAHSFLIGLALATDPSFIILFVVIIFHQTFEGLGLGARLAYLPLPHQYNWIAPAAALLYACITPIGLAIGLGIRHSYNSNASSALIASGVLDSIAAGVLLYTGLVELLAHEFIFNKEMINATNGHVAYALGSMLVGAALMALLGRWA